MTRQQDIPMQEQIVPPCEPFTGEGAVDRELAERYAQQVRLFNRVLSSITDFAYTFDLQGRFTFVNKPLLDLWGLTLEQAVGKDFFDLKYPDDLAGKLQRQIQQVIQTKQRLVDETPYTNPAGALGYYQYIFSPVLGADGAVEAVAGSTRDISDYKRLEAERERLTRAVESERAKLAGVIEQAPAFICTLRGPNHVFELANELYYEMAGRRDIIGKPVREAFPDVEGQGFFELLDNVYRTGEAFTGNEMPILLRRTGGLLDRRYINFVYQALRDADGRVSGIFVHGVDVTAMVHSREALREREEHLRTSEERLAFALGAAELGTFYCPMPLGEIVWNDTCKEHFWLPPDAKIDFDLFYAIIHPDDRERTRRAVEQTVYGRQPYDVEYRTVAPDGRVRWLRAKGRAYHDAAGNPTRFDGVTLDLTRQKEAQQALRESEEFHRFAAEAGRTGSWYVRLDTMECILSPMMTELMGFPAGQTTASAEEWRNKVIPEDQPGLEAAIAASIERDVPLDFEFRIALEDGTQRWIYSHGGVARDASGKPLRIHGASVDLTERKWTEERERQVAAEAIAAAETNAKFRTFFDQGTYFAGVMALDGTIIEANRLCLEACGYTREEVIGKKFWECGWWNRSPDLVEWVRAGSIQAAAGQLFRREMPYFVADGSERMVDLTIAPVKDATGRVLFIAPTGADITEKKLLADERERLLDAERRARADAETANRAKDKFLAVLSHELRTPLSPVVMTIPALEIDPDLPFKFREDLAMVRRNIDLEVKLIDDLLDLSRVTTGKLRLQMQPVHGHEVLRHAIHSSFSDASAKRLRVRQELRAADDRLIADPARLQQVFWNVLRNAVKFTPQEGEIAVRTFNDGDGRLVVEIQDNGAGIPPDILPRIFDAFEQGDARVTRQFGGLGLGLAIAKAVVEMHGGKISAASGGRDQGSVFTIQLNLAPQTSITESAAPDSRIAGDLKGFSSRVLLVEDHPDTARTMERVLNGSGFYVKSAQSVAAALQLAAAEPFDVLVSDIGLPDATGYELMRQIRGLYGMKGIALSGYGMEEDVRQSREAGFSEHLVKPVNISQLEGVLRRVLEVRGS